MTLSAETIAIALDAIRDRYYPATSRAEYPRDLVQTALRELTQSELTRPSSSGILHSRGLRGWK